MAAAPSAGAAAADQLSRHRGATSGDDDRSGDESLPVAVLDDESIAVGVDRGDLGTGVDRGTARPRDPVEGIDELAPALVQVDDTAQCGVQLRRCGVGRERLEVAAVGADPHRGCGNRARHRIGEAALDPLLSAHLHQTGIAAIGAEAPEESGQLGHRATRRDAPQMTTDREPTPEQRRATTLRDDAQLPERCRTVGPPVQRVRTLVQAEPAVFRGASPPSQITAGVEDVHNGARTRCERRCGQAGESTAHDRDVDRCRRRCLHDALLSSVSADARNRASTHRDEPRPAFVTRPPIDPQIRVDVAARE